jgi:glycine oxidase
VRVGTAVDDIQIGGNVQIHGQQFAAAVISAGAWSGHIRVNGRCELPAAEPVKGHLLGFELPLGACPTIVRHKDIYLFQRGTGAVVAGASVEHVGYEREVDEAVWRPLLTRIRRVLPVLEKVRPVEVWTGLRPKSDAMHIGAWKDMPLFLAYGHYRNGILLAPVTAERIAQALA